MSQGNYPDQGCYGQGSNPQGGFGYSYNVDLVLCIDATKSMEPVIQLVKDNAIQLPQDILDEAVRQRKSVNNLRIKVILFRDYLADGNYAIQTTDFMEMPQQVQEFSKLVDSIEAVGGGDEPEDGLEALAYAMSSKWQQPNGTSKCRQVIALWTDASTHKLGHGRTASNYDPKLPANFDMLTDWWGDEPGSSTGKMHYQSKRLVLFAPKEKYWTTINDNWDNVIYVPSVAGQGLREHSYKEIIALLVGSI